MGTHGKAAAAAAMAPSPGKPTTLLDVQEVEWITRELERLLVREAGGGDTIHYRRRNKRAKVMSPPAPKPEANKKKGGFLAELLGKHAVSICGDAAAAAVLPGRGCRRRRGRGGSFREVDKQV